MTMTSAGALAALKQQKRTEALIAATSDGLVPPGDNLWGIGAIAGFLGIGVDKAREMARNDSVPIYKPDGQPSYWASRTELRSWLRRKVVE